MIKRWITCKFDMILHNTYTLFKKNVQKTSSPESKLSKLLKSGRLHTYFQAQIALGLLQSQNIPTTASPTTSTVPSADIEFKPATELLSAKRSNCQFGNDHSTKSRYAIVQTFCHVCGKKTCLSHMTYTCKKCF